MYFYKRCQTADIFSQLRCVECIAHCFASVSKFYNTYFVMIRIYWIGKKKHDRHDVAYLNARKYFLVILKFLNILMINCRQESYFKNGPLWGNIYSKHSNIYIKIATFSAATDRNFVKIMTFLFQKKKKKKHWSNNWPIEMGCLVMHVMENQHKMQHWSLRQRT